MIPVPCVNTVCSWICLKMFLVISSEVTVSIKYSSHVVFKDVTYTWELSVWLNSFTFAFAVWVDLLSRYMADSPWTVSLVSSYLSDWCVLVTFICKLVCCSQALDSCCSAGKFLMYCCMQQCFIPLVEFIIVGRKIMKRNDMSTFYIYTSFLGLRFMLFSYVCQDCAIGWSEKS
jgi:hypothetical protein